MRPYAGKGHVEAPTPASGPRARAGIWGMPRSHSAEPESAAARWSVPRGSATAGLWPSRANWRMGRTTQPVRTGPPRQREQPVDQEPRPKPASSTPACCASAFSAPRPAANAASAPAGPDSSSPGNSTAASIAPFAGSWARGPATGGSGGGPPGPPACATAMSIAQPNTATARSKWRAAGGWYSTPPGALGGGGSLALDSTEAAYASRDGCEVSVSPKWRRTACIDGRRM